MAATLYLQRRGRVTAAELAEHLEVSLATARRDLEALGAAGIPVYPQPGRRGGWQLVGGARTDLSGLSEPEVRALFLALGGLDGGAPAAGTALAKLVRALPEPFSATIWSYVGASGVRMNELRTFASGLSGRMSCSTICSRGIVSRKAWRTFFATSASPP